MIIEQAIHDELLATSGVTALVGEKIHYVKAPQDVVPPYIVLTKITSNPTYSHDGAVNLCESVIQISIFATTYNSVKLIAAQVKNVLNAYSGTMGGVSGVIVNSCFHENEIDLYEEGQELYHLAEEYRLWHNE